MKMRKKNVLEKAAWITYAFVELNKDAVLTGINWKFPVKAVFFFHSLILEIVITITSIVSGHSE